MEAQDYKKLVKALRCCSKDKCGQCEYEWNPNRELCMNSMCADAADAIEELQQIADHHEQTAKDYWKEACEYKAQLPNRGEWEREFDVHDEPFYQCSVCGECFDSNRDSTHEVFKYCPDCGAKMGVQDDKA